MTHSLPLFVAMLVPGALGIGLCNPSLVSLVSGAAGKHEQGRVQGAAGALESLGRTIGPVWGNGVLQWFGEGVAYGSAALVLLGTAALSTRYKVPPTIRTTLNYAVRTMIRTLSLAVFLAACRAPCCRPQTPAPNPEEAAILAVIDRFMHGDLDERLCPHGRARIEGGSTIVSRRDPAGRRGSSRHPPGLHAVDQLEAQHRPGALLGSRRPRARRHRRRLDAVRVLGRRQVVALRHRRVRHDEGQGRLEDRQRDVDGRARRLRGAASRRICRSCARPVRPGRAIRGRRRSSGSSRPRGGSAPSP